MEHPAESFLRPTVAASDLPPLQLLSEDARDRPCLLWLQAWLLTLLTSDLDLYLLDTSGCQIYNRTADAFTVCGLSQPGL